MHSVDDPAAPSTDPADAVGPTTVGRNNLASAGISVEKLNGQVYTPLTLAKAVVDRLRWFDGRPGILLDASCGDGVFLQAAVERLVRQGRPSRIVDVVGYDLDPQAVAAARARLDACCERLGVAPRPRIEHRDALRGVEPASAFVGNPPYLEAKRMPQPLKRRIKSAFPLAARGAFDLYGAFVELGLKSLDDDGELALIVPNRVLVTRATGALRQSLLDSGRVGVVDLSAEDVFADAAVYPVVLRLERGTSPGYRVEDLDRTTRVALSADAIGRLDGRFPLPPPELRDLITRLLADPTSYPPLRQHVAVRWTVSFHRGGLRDAFVFAERPNSPHARPFLGGHRFSGNREVGAFHIDWAGAWIDYDEDRARAERNPLPPRALFDWPKVAIPQNARRPRAALDTSGAILKDTFLAAMLQPEADPDWLPWLVLVINSGLFHHLYEALYGGTRKGGKYLHLLGSYLHPMPVPPPPPGAETLHRQLVDDPGSSALRAQAETLVRGAYDITQVEAAALDGLELPS